MTRWLDTGSIGLDIVTSVQLSERERRAIWILLERELSHVNVLSFIGYMTGHFPMRGRRESTPTMCQPKWCNTICRRSRWQWRLPQRRSVGSEKAFTMTGKLTRQECSLEDANLMVLTCLTLCRITSHQSMSFWWQTRYYHLAIQWITTTEVSLRLLNSQNSNQ